MFFTSSSRSSSGKAAGSGGGGGKAAIEDACALSFETPLNGPDPEVIKTLKKGDILDVEVRKGGKYPSVVCVVPKTKEVAGSLATASQVAVLIECIGQGNKYSAKIANSSKPPIVTVYRTGKSKA